MAITSTLMADPIPTTSWQEIGITQLIHAAPVVAAEADVPVHVLAPPLAWPRRLQPKGHVWKDKVKQRYDLIYEGVASAAPSFYYSTNGRITPNELSTLMVDQ